MLPALQRLSEPGSSSLVHHRALTDSSGTFQILSEMSKITAAEVKDISTADGNGFRLSLLSPPYKLWQRSVLMLETEASREPSAVDGPCMGSVIPCQPETTSLCLEPASSTSGQISTVPFLLLHLP